MFKTSETLEDLLSLLHDVRKTSGIVSLILDCACLVSAIQIVCSDHYKIFYCTCTAIFCGANLLLFGVWFGLTLCCWLLKDYADEIDKEDHR